MLTFQPLQSTSTRLAPSAVMDAMIFAAGLGTRLRPLTDDRPKALVEIGGVPILEIVARRLIAAGADRLIINTHWHGGMIADFVHAKGGFGVDVRISHEPDAPLDTGGGLACAATHFRRDKPFLLHNCDVISDVDLEGLYAAHVAGDAIATLAVLPPSPERYLAFDDAGLCGYGPRGGGDQVLCREVNGTVQRFDFTGIHAASPALLDSLPPTGSYSIMDHYLRLARAGTPVKPWLQPDAHWIDIGTHEKLAEAESFLKN